MEQTQLAWITGYIWGIVDDVLRDLCVRGKCRDVFLPMTVLRRLDAVLENSKQAVLEIPAPVAEDAAYRNAQKNSGEQNARIEHDKALVRVMTAVMKDDTELFKQFMDNEGFKRWMKDTVFGLGLVFVPSADPSPEKPGGGLDWDLVTAVTIIGIEDTHG